MGPFVADGSSEYYRLCNLGKESIALNLKDPNQRAARQGPDRARRRGHGKLFAPAS